MFMGKKIGLEKGNLQFDSPQFRPFKSKVFRFEDHLKRTFKSSDGLLGK